MTRLRFDDHGGATVWVLSAGLVAVLVALAMAMAGAVIVARHRAQAAADLAALAGAARLTEGVAAACARATEFAQANGAQLRSCLADGWDLVVSVSVRPPVFSTVSGSVVATARAGPAEQGAYGVQRRRGHAASRWARSQWQDAPWGVGRVWCEPVGSRPEACTGRSDMELSLATHSVAEHTVLEIGGEIDVYTAPRLRERLQELVDDGHSRLVIDLARVEFLDSTGLGVLVGAHRRVRAAGGTFSLVCPHDRLLKLFRITGLELVFEIHPSIEAAVATTGADA